MNYFVQWLDRHKTIIKSYMTKYVPYSAREEFLEKLYLEPENAYKLLISFKMKNKEKLQIILDSLIRKDYVLVSVFGEPGSGKTAFAEFLCYKIKELTGIPIYTYASFEYPSFFEDSIFDLNFVPNDCFLYIDELAKAFPSRSFQDPENQKLQQQLIDMRHRGVKIIGSTQKARLVDLTYFLFDNFRFFKYIKPDSFMEERENILSDLIVEMLPRSSADLQKVVCSLPDYIFDYSFTLPDWFSEKLSKSYAHITQDKIEAFARSRLESGYSTKEIRRYLEQRLHISKSEGDWQSFFALL